MSHDAACVSIKAYRMKNRTLYPPGWSVLEKATKQAHPYCAFCEAKAKAGSALQVHHVAPIHLHPELALDPGNLIVLCSPCHFSQGHVGDFQHGFDPRIVSRAATNFVAIQAARVAVGLRP